jgi:glycyl-tRNA synthetase beta chain
MQTKDFLFELGCEELPIASVKQLSDALGQAMEFYLAKNKLSYEKLQCFATPRRLAVLVYKLAVQQPSFTIERIGPSIEAAYAKDGSPSIAFLGFARSCQVSIDKISTKETPRGKKLYCLVEKKGALTTNLLPDLLDTVIKKLPIGKAMRWSDFEYNFARPVHWVVALFGRDIIPFTLFGIRASNRTTGHRFHAPQSFVINEPKEYVETLTNKAFVIPSFTVRRALIKKLATNIATTQGIPLVDEALLNEVTSLVEWPIAYLGHFNEAFLKTPKEALIASMKVHQRCFPVVDDQGALKPYFVIISNLQSKRPETVIAGNVRVINARLADAAFFYTQDLKQSLESRLAKLKIMTFQEKLGSMLDRVKRLERIVACLGKALNQSPTIIKHTKRAAKLSKSDLTSALVYEFPELQGIAGYYYARADREPNACAMAIREHYNPRFSGDALPSTIPGQLVALADKIDTLIGIIGLNQIPSGDKDPFALRRAALGIIRISIEKSLSFDLKKLLKMASELFHTSLPNKKVVLQSFDFIMQRLKSWYLDQGISSQQFMSVAVVDSTNLVDFDQRLQAVSVFLQIPEAESLSIANKRVMNILKKQKITPKNCGTVDSALFETDAEKKLWQSIKRKRAQVISLSKKQQYGEALVALAELKAPSDAFFDSVFVMVEKKRIQKNRLALLAELRQLLTSIADIAYLST